MKRRVKAIATELTPCSNSMGSGWYLEWYAKDGDWGDLFRNEMQYLGYTKKEVIAKARANGIMVKNDVIKYGYLI